MATRISLESSLEIRGGRTRFRRGVLDLLGAFELESGETAPSSEFITGLEPPEVHKPTVKSTAIVQASEKRPLVLALPDRLKKFYPAFRQKKLG